MKSFIAIGLLSACLQAGGAENEQRHPNRCEAVPLPDHQVSFQVDGDEKLRWHFDEKYPRPFFFPFNGPSGETLTRMGHPGAENHDHHRSVWFAHRDVNGFDFWADPRHTRKPGRIRQKHWIAYADGPVEAVMAVRAGWFDDAGAELMEQDIVAALTPLTDGDHLLEIQITLRPPKSGEAVKLGKTNFGFLAVRVAKSISAHFGGGQLHNSESLAGEAAIFGKPARWMDYSGPVAVGRGRNRSAATEGITFYDHPSNPRHPVKWHVREDGWMGASFCMDEGWRIEKDQSLTLRYLLHAHSGDYNAARAERTFQSFASRPGFAILKSTRKHRQYEVRRKKN